MAKTYNTIALMDKGGDVKTDSLTADQLTALSYEAVLIIADTTQENGLYSIWFKGQWRTIDRLPSVLIECLTEDQNHGN